MIVEIYIGFFYCVVTLVTCLIFRQKNRSYNYLSTNYSKKHLTEYIDSYFYDKRITKKLKTKKQLVRFIIQTTENLHNVKECNICYEHTDYIRVHKCKICTMMICMNCLNRFVIPTKCPQCSTNFYFQEIMNRTIHYISYDNWCRFVLICLMISMFIVFVSSILFFFSYIKK